MRIGYSNNRSLAEKLISQGQRDAVLVKWVSGITAVFCRADEVEEVRKKLNVANLSVQRQPVYISEHVRAVLVDSSSQTKIREALLKEEE